MTMRDTRCNIRYFVAHFLILLVHAHRPKDKHRSTTLYTNGNCGSKT